MDRPRSAGMEEGEGYRFLPKRVLAAPFQTLQIQNGYTSALPS